MPTMKPIVFAMALASLPVCLLLGGRYGEAVTLYRAISQQSPDEMAASVGGYRSEGYTRFQLKVGGDPDRGNDFSNI